MKSIYILTYELEGVEHIVTAYTSEADAKRYALVLAREFSEQEFYPKSKTLAFKQKPGYQVCTQCRGLMIKIHSRILDGVCK